MVVWAAPRHTVHDPNALRVAIPLVVVGVAAVLAYVAARIRPSAQLLLLIGAGLAYAWVDFTNKLLANDVSSARWLLAGVWLIATVAFGALAFLEETTALQRRPAVSVAPIIGAIHDPLPVVLALWAGVETWGAGAHHIVPLIAGLAIIAVGAATLGRSQAVARISGNPDTAAGSRLRLASCAPSRPCAPPGRQAAWEQGAAA